MELSFRGTIPKLISSQNIAEDMSEEDLRIIGLQCKAEFEGDKASRAQWEEWYADSLELALQVMKEKSFPWPNCSNIKFPLITIAAINFHARAFPALLNPSSVVSYRVIGKDPDGIKSLRACRVEDHQNWMLLEATDWEEHEDKALLIAPILGCAFKKAAYNKDKKVVGSVLVLPQDLVVPYYTASLEEAVRISQLFNLTSNAFKTRVRRGDYLDVEYSSNYGLSPDGVGPIEAVKAEIQKVQPTSTEAKLPRPMVEQHRYLDLDGDGYAEPYIVTFLRETGQVTRIVARFDTTSIEYAKKDKSKIAYISPDNYFIKKPFIPSPDGGFYDVGFGMLLGPLNHAANSLINQLVDAGTMEILGGGFLGRGVKIKRGTSTFAPYEWKQVDSPGASLKDNIVPLPTRSPSNVLLELLQFLVSYGERVSSANDIAMGELPGQNVKAQTAELANNNGQKIFQAIFKRWWRASKQEFVYLYKLTSIHIQSMEAAKVMATGEWFDITPEDYKMPSDGIWPTADPNVSSPEAKQKRAAMVLDVATKIAGQDVREATMRFYKAHDIPEAEKLFPDPKGPNAIPQQPNEKLIAAQAKMLLAQEQANTIRQQRAIAMQKLLSELQESQARVIELMARAAKERAEAKGVPIGHSIALMDAQIAQEKNHMDKINSLIDAIKVIGDLNNAQSDNSAAAGGAGATDDGSSGVLPLAGSAGNPEVLPLSDGPPEGNARGMGEA